MRNFIRTLVLAGGMLALSGGAQAGLLGDSVTLAYDYPTFGSGGTGSPVTIGAGAEYTHIALVLTFDFTNTQLIITTSQDTGFSLGAVNGPRFDDVTTPFTSVTIDSATTAAWFTSSMVSINNAGSLLINWQGQGFAQSEQIVLDLAPPDVAEPASLALLVLGMSGLAAGRRRRAARG